MSETKNGADRWAQPQAVDPVMVVFPAHVVGSLLPERGDVPAEFWRDNPWSEMASRWFFNGRSAPPAFKPGIDASAALRHLRACLGSWEPQHEHKEAGVGYLLSLWCVSPDTDTPKKGRNK